MADLLSYVSFQPGVRCSSMIFNKTFYLQLYGMKYMVKETGRKEGTVLFNNTFNTFYLLLYGMKYMVKET